MTTLELTEAAVKIKLLWMERKVMNWKTSKLVLLIAKIKTKVLSSTEKQALLTTTETRFQQSL